MARRKNAKPSTGTTTFRHESATRTNIPPAKIAAEGKVPAVPKQKYAYSPHLAPILRFDPEGRADKVREVVEKACAGKSLTAEEQEILKAVAKNWESPWLEWAGKQEEHDRHWRTVDPVALHIHERVSASAILRTARRKDIQRSLFADPELEYREAVQFYQHDVDWANRLILGDSLQVMASLARREDLAGKVQMIYMDPPYGIKFASNFQPEVGKRDVMDKDLDFTRESEMVKAYRDTWNLGTHSYLSYLRNRLIVSREILSDSGSIFVQIGEENLHRVRLLLEEIFGASQFVATISYKTSIGLGSKLLDSVTNYLLWFSKDKERLKYRPLFLSLNLGSKGATRYSWSETEVGEIKRLSSEQRNSYAELPKIWRPLFKQGLTSRSGSATTAFLVQFAGKNFRPTVGGWRTGQQGMKRVIGSERILVEGKRLTFKKFFLDFGSVALTNFWTDVGGGISSRSDPKIYVVQTATKVVQRCMLMTTDPGDLVVDPTCGSGTTAYVAEKWGRRWITIDTSRVALSLARQRFLTAKFDRYRLASESDIPKEEVNGRGLDPKVNFIYNTVPHITLGSIARNENLDPIFARHEPILDEKLGKLNEALSGVQDSLREKLAAKLATKMQNEGLRAATDADRRRWLLPGTTRKQIATAFTGKSRLKPKHVQETFEKVPPDGKFEHWHVPFDTDPDWPEALARAVTEYRKAWRAKMDEVNACIAANAEQEVLVDQPEVVKGVVRVSGPFTVEGVMPEELNIGEEGLFDGTPNEELEFGEVGEARGVEVQNLHAYLTAMVTHLKRDGVTFPGNKNPRFARLEPLFDADSASALHAEGVWEGGDAEGPAKVGVGFGPQYGPVTAMQVEELVREANRRGYDELVVAGFSFDAEAHAILAEDPHPKVRVHMAQIRPDINPGMEGLLKDTPNSQLFTVFGTPSIELRREGEEYTVTLEGVDIYDPVRNVVQSTGASKVAAWFLDSDYDGRCFCITQAFFPDQDAWGKLAKALKDVVDPDAFAAFKGTTSLPFQAGKHGRIAVKVIDPRGNEVMTIHKLESAE